MNMFNLKEVSAAANAMTQAGFLGLTSAAPIGGQFAHRVFTQTSVASMTGDVMFRVGAGEMDASIHARIIGQIAADKGQDAREAAQAYLKLLAVVAFDRSVMTKVIASIVGTSDRPTQGKNISRVLPTFIYLQLVKALPDAKDHDEVHLQLITDYICHMLRPLDWIMHDDAFVFRLRRPNLFPSYASILDMLAIKDTHRVLSVMAAADLSVLKQIADTKAAISPALVTVHIVGAMQQAYDLSKRTYDAHAVAGAVLTTCIRIWDASTPTEIAPSDRVRKIGGITQLLGNLSMFLAAQDMMKNYPDHVDVTYGDEEMSSVVVPHFMDALAEISPFKLRLIDDVTAHFGKRTSRDAYDAPAKTAIYELYDMTATTHAFTPIRHLQGTAGRYLRGEPSVTACLDQVLKPVQAIMDVKSIVETRAESFDMISSEIRSHNAGTDVLFGFPSVIEREVEMGLRSGALQQFLLNGSIEDALMEQIKNTKEGAPSDALIQTRLRAIAYDYYAMLVHLAVSNASNAQLSVTPVHKTDTTPANLALAWEIRTKLIHPLGDAAILNGVVTTSEPIEALVYSDDFHPRATLTPRPIDIKDFADDVHIWDWRKVSVQLVFSAPYVTRVRNKQYEVTMQEFEMLGLGISRSNLYYFRPTTAAAVVRLWLEWSRADREFIASKMKSKDEIQATAFRGRQIHNATALAVMLLGLGTTGVGAKISGQVRRRLAQEMYAKGAVDDAAELSVGIQDIRLNMWAGLTTLNIMGLIEPADVTELYNYLQETDALANIISARAVARNA